MNQMIALSIFLVAYLFIATEKFNRIAIALTGAGIMLALRLTDPKHAFFSHETGVDWNVIFLLLGMMIIVSVIHKTGFFESIAIRLVRAAGGKPVRILIYLSIFVALASALLDNVTTIMLAVPMTITVARQLKLSPIPFILAEIFSSNIGGAATLIGDPPNIIIASRANIGFNDFLVHMAPMVLIVMAFILPLFVLLFRRQLVSADVDVQAISNLDPSAYIKDRVLLTKSLYVLALAILGFLTHPFTHIEPSVIALLSAGVLVAITRLKPRDYALDIEWGTLLFFAGLFIMVGTLVKVGVLSKLADILSTTFEGRLELATFVTLGLSALLSGIVDNIPYVASMTPVISDLSSSLLPAGDHTLWWALAFGADFGGNLTIVGASANVVGVGLAAAAGYRITFMQFLRYGLPVTLLSIVLVVPYLYFFYLI